jgi:RNA polymerase sigma-70 factor (ECF subfamily)
MQDNNDLVIKAQKGDLKAFEQLVTNYDRLVLNIAFAYTKNKYDADDIYQEVFIRVFRGLKNFQLRSQFTTWLYRIAVNVCIEHKRKEKIHSHNSFLADEDESNISVESTFDNGIRTDTEILNSEMQKLINGEVEKLPKQLKMAFTLKYYQGMKIKDISNFMNCSEGTVKSYLFTSSRKLRDKLKPILEM